MTTSVSKRKRKNKSKKNLTSESISLKEKLAQKRKARAKKVKFLKFLSLSIAIGALLGIPLGIVMSPKIGIATFIAIITIIFSYQYPRTALWAFLIYMPFGGTITYWLAGGNVLFQIAKDAFYIPALLALVVDCKRRGKNIFVAKTLIPTLTFLVILAVLTLFVVNGAQQFLPTCGFLEIYDLEATCKEGVPFLQGILGLKILIGYIPLIFCGYYLIEDKKQLLFLGRLLLIIAIICCLLGLTQYWFLKTGRCDGTRFATGDDLFRASLGAKCLVGGSLLYSPGHDQIRLPGTFVSPWHWGWFLIANSAITFTLAFFETSFAWKLAGFAGMGLVFINAVISGQRIALALVPIFTLIMLIFTGQITNLKRFIPIGVGLMLALIVFASINPGFFQERIDSFVTRWNSTPPHLFMIKQFAWAIQNYQFYNNFGVLGAGLGTATTSTRTFGPIAFVETFHPKLIYEIGFLGLFAFMAFITHLIIYTFKQYLLLREPILRSFALSFWVFLFIIGYFPYWYPLDTDPVAIYYWFFAGVLIKLSQIDKQERQKEIYAHSKKKKIRSRTFTRLRKRRKLAE